MDEARNAQILADVRDFISQLFEATEFTHIASFGAFGQAPNGSKGVALMFIVREGGCTPDEAWASLASAVYEVGAGIRVMQIPKAGGLSAN